MSVTNQNSLQILPSNKTRHQTSHVMYGCTSICIQRVLYLKILNIAELPYYHDFIHILSILNNEIRWR